MKKAREQTERITIRFTKEKLEQLNAIASKKGEFISETTRRLLDKGLTIEASKEDINFIRQQIREELRNILEPKIERIIKLIVKSGIMSAGAFYLNAGAISGLLPPSKQEDYRDVLDEAKKYGVVHFQLKDSTVEELIRKLKYVE